MIYFISSFHFISLFVHFFNVVDNTYIHIKVHSFEISIPFGESWLICLSDGESAGSESEGGSLK